MKYIKNRSSLFALILIAFGLIYFNYSFNPTNILSWDVFGYYMYLPMTFIYHNWDLHNTTILHTIIDQYQNTESLYQAYATETGSWIMRYSMGMSMLYSPFFALGHFIAGFTNYPQDGFSRPYQIAILCAGIFYSILGFYFLRKILLHYFTESVTAATLLIIYFGTNYFMHSSFNGSNAMTHNYLFTMYALIVWFTFKWHETFKIKYIIYLGLACGLNIVSRPSEMVCLLIPLLWKVGGEYSLFGKLGMLYKRRYQVVAFLAALFIVVLPQLIYWKMISGKFIYNSYGDNPGEGFEFAHPYLREVLFSFRKGWFIYTPVMIFSVIGVYNAYKQKRDYSSAVFFYFILNLFIVSSWSCWWYAESFSQRALIQSYGILVLPLGTCISSLANNTRRWLKYVIFSVITLMVVLNLFQTWQFIHEIIHSSRMTKAAYVAGFGKTKRPDEMDRLLMIDRGTTEARTIDPNEYVMTHEWTQDFEDTPHSTMERAYSGVASEKMDSSFVYSPTIVKTFSELTEKDHVKMRISMWIYCTSDKGTQGSLVATFDHKDQTYGYEEAVLDSVKIEANKWMEIKMNYVSPVIRTAGDRFKVYYWFRAGEPVYIDKLNVEVWERKSN